VQTHIKSVTVAKSLVLVGANLPKAAAAAAAVATSCSTVGVEGNKDPPGR